jgi:acyl-CoA dehydrogenase
MSLSFALSPALAEYGRALRDWSATECRPFAREADTSHDLPDNWASTLDTCPVPLKRWDRPDAAPLPSFEDGPWIRQLVTTESLNYGDTWVSWACGGGIGHLVVQGMGTPEQIERWYKPIVTTGGRTAFALTEPQFGSDTSMVSTTAVRDGDTWVINGTKMYCSFGGVADYVVVFATIGKELGPSAIKAFVVEKGTPGLLVAKLNESKLGIRSAVTSELLFQDCAIPVENQLGWSGDGTAGAGGKTRSGRSGALGALAQNKPNMSAMAIGMAQASIDVATDLLTERQAGFAPHRWSRIESELQNMADVLTRARLMNFKAQFLTGRGLPSKIEASMAKAYGPATCEQIIRRCMQLLGPDGTSTDLLLEKWYRDCKIIDIFEGSGQVQRIIVGRSVVGSDAG